MTNERTDLLPDEIYAALDGSDGTYWVSQRHEAFDRTDNIPQTKYIRADLVSTPSSTRANECCIPDAGEPSFVLLGRDKQAPALVEKWADDREKERPHSTKPTRARLIAKQMREYSGTKHPPQPSPQSDMVAVPREVVDRVTNILNEVASRELGVNLIFMQVTKALYLLQPYTKGE